MKTHHEEKLSLENKALRQELHRARQKNRDIEKSRVKYKQQVITQKEKIKDLENELKKKQF